MVGRDAEIGSLLRSVTSPPSVALVEGEAGIGKSRLVAETLAHAHLVGRRVLVGVCHPLAEPHPLGPLVDALRRAAHVPDRGRLTPLSGALRYLLPELADSLPAWPGDADPCSDRNLVFRAVREFLGALGPAVLVLEDMQWCDGATADFLRFLTAEIPRNVALVLTYRGEEVEPESPLRTLALRCPPDVVSVRVVLAPLTSAEVHTLTVHLAEGAEVSTEFTARLHDRTAGIPFVVEEMVRLVDDRCEPARRLPSARAWEIDAAGVPETIRDAVAGRVGRLPPDARRVVEAASVIGSPADLSQLVSVCGLSRSRVIAALRAAVDTAVLLETADGRHCHRHALAGQAAYEAIPRVERGLLHLRAAATLEALLPRPVAQLARHYREAGALASWVAAAEAAADIAVSAWDFAGAFRLLSDVVPLDHLTVRDRSRLASKLARAALLGKVGRGEAASLLRRMIETASLPIHVRGHLRHLLGDLMTSLGDRSGGRRELSDAVCELRHSADLRGHALATLAIPWGPAGELREHMRYLDQAMEELPRSRDPATAIGILAMRAEVLLCTGDRAGRRAAKSIPWQHTSIDARRALLWTALNLVDPCYHLGEYQRARGLLTDANARAVALDYRPLPEVFEGAAVALDWATGAWEGLSAQAQSFADRNADEPLMATRSRRIAGLLALAAGRLEAAEGMLRTAFATAESGGTAPGMAAAAAGLARVRLAQGDACGARDEAVRGLEVVRRKGIWVWAAEVAPPAVEAMLSCGDVPAAAELIEGFAAGLRNRHAPLARAALAACRGMLAEARGRLEGGAHEFERAEHAYAALPRPHDAAQMAARRGALLLSAGDRRGSHHLSQALERFTALGASGDAARARRVLRQHSIEAPSGRRGGRTGYGGRLTPRQHEVAELAAHGFTNRQIGTRLGLSSRTVANHLALAMNKLGMRSRTVLARRWDGGPAEAAIG